MGKGVCKHFCAAWNFFIFVCGGVVRGLDVGAGDCGGLARGWFSECGVWAFGMWEFVGLEVVTVAFDIR